jgi:hypothetical protein
VGKNGDGGGREGGGVDSVFILEVESWSGGGSERSGPTGGRAAI